MAIRCGDASFWSSSSDADDPAKLPKRGDRTGAWCIGGGGRERELRSEPACLCSCPPKTGGTPILSVALFCDVGPKRRRESVCSDTTDRSRTTFNMGLERHYLSVVR